MGGAVLANQPRPVDGKAHWKFLQGYVMNNLVIGALQKRGIDGTEGLEPFGRQARGKCYCVLFGNANIKHAFRKLFGKFIKAGARSHGSGDGNDLLVLFRFRDECLGKNTGVGRRIACGVLELQSFGIKARDGVVVFLVRF